MEISISQHSMKLLLLQQTHILAKHWWLFVLNLTPIRAWSSALPEGMNVLHTYPSQSRNTEISLHLLKDILQNQTLNSLIAWMLTLPRALKLINKDMPVHLYTTKQRQQQQRKKKKDVIAVLLLCISRDRKTAAEMRGASKKKEKRWNWWGGSVNNWCEVSFHVRKTNWANFLWTSQRGIKSHFISAMKKI